MCLTEYDEARTFAEQRAEAIKNLIKYGMSVEEIARVFDCSPHEIENINFNVSAV
ncbi:helix-turn-helix domain-containing protein [bacterium]|nr:helix-turn-helix domain-containing protein [bacterium]